MSFAGKLLASHGDFIPVQSSTFHRAIGTPTNAGIRVSEQSAFGVTAVYSAIGQLADAVAGLPIEVKQRLPDGGALCHPKHPVAVLLTRQSNPLMTPIVLRHATQTHVLGWGNGYLEVQRDNTGTPIALWPLLPDRTERQGRERGNKYRTIVDSQQFFISADDVIHIPAMGFDGLRGYSPIWMARQAIGLALALEEFGGKFFSNDAKSGGFIEHPGKLSTEAQDRLRESFQKQGGLTNAHRMKILEEGMKYTATTIAPEDAQFIESRSFQVEEIARLYRMPLFMLQSQSKTTAWGTGIAEMSLGFVRYTLAPWLIRWEQELALKLFTQEELDAGFFVRHNLDSLLRGDAKARSDQHTKALSPTTGWMDRNEVRALEDLNPEEVPEAPPQIAVV